MVPDRQLWAGMLSHLRAQHAACCRQWFEEIEPLGVGAGVLRLRAHSAIHRDYLQRECSDAFNDAARTVSQRLVSVQFLGPDDEPEVPADPEPVVVTRNVAQVIAGAARNSAGATAVAEPLPPPAAKPLWRATATHSIGSSSANNGSNGSRDHASSRYGHSLVINPDYAFEHFVVGPENRLAHAAAQAIAANPGRAYNPFFVHGDVGLGKTHLLQAICLRIAEANRHARIFYTSCEGFITQFMEAVQAGEMAAFRHTFRDVDVLVIDDVHFLAKRDRTQEEFFHTFNSLYQSHKQIILSSDAPPEEIPDLEDRLVSRFKWGLVTVVEPPCYETRLAILKNKAAMRGFVLPEDVAAHLAAKIDSNIRELEGAIVKLQMMASVEHKPIDMALARQALGDDGDRSEKQLQIQTIISTVTDFYGVKVPDLQSKRRQRSIALPRQVCMYLARKNTRYSLEEIGGYFGGRDHTTVMHAVRTVESRCGEDQEFAKVVAGLEQQLKLVRA